jgi:hypothetical protein
MNEHGSTRIKGSTANGIATNVELTKSEKNGRKNVAEGNFQLMPENRRIFSRYARTKFHLMTERDS